VGPTAVGKTQVAACLAKKINGEIISCDSMQVYKGMDILTSKPSPALRKRVSHHLIGAVEPREEYNVSKYRKAALLSVKDILKRGKTPIFSGGTGLYVSMLVDGIFEAKSGNKSIRQRLYQEAKARGSAYLFKRLRKVDPQAASKIHPHDTKRIVRALEVFETMGRPISELQAERRGLANEYNVNIFCLDMPRDRLYDRINKRVDKMFRQGLVKEVRRLLKLKLSKTSRFAIGIREIKDYLEGMYDLGQAKELIKRNTRWYAKRQLTWFRKDKRIYWIKIGQGEKPESAAREIKKALSVNSAI
ncbi:MAG: tRNA (adenosine(37)-N6)-dimethylallyltransferase MiaA, partial [Candidatus Omnitrophica bacterium]|nr:tRNA (adenosine(37)-N6)-dimethylallyltransferase MiaA [Candidatus Omnitrophota bacterium]